MAARLNIYVPDDLAEEVREVELNVSRIAQEALMLELRRRVPPADVRAVAERLRGTADPERRRKVEHFHGLGVSWARSDATLDELRDLVFESATWTHWDPGEGHSLRRFLDERAEWPDEVRIPLQHTPAIDAFIDGATAVWKDVAPLLRDANEDDTYEADIDVRDSSRKDDVKIEESAVLIRIARLYRPTMSDAELYEATRKWWVRNPNRTPNYAFSVFGGTVQAVYKIDDWERPPREERVGRLENRWAFRGERDPAMEARYVGADVSSYFPRGAAFPFRYVNC